MSIDDPNLEMVLYVANALGDLRNSFVFVGGCAAGLLITDTSRAAIRSTTDVDLIVEVGSRVAYQRLAELLRSKGFCEDTESDVLCRWKLHGVTVDVMPADPSVLGFSNDWYQMAIDTSMNHQLPDGSAIRLVSPALLIAMKISAFYGRGGGDFTLSHDVEDIVAVVDGRPELAEEVASSDEVVREFLQDELETWLGTEEFVASISYHLRPDAVSQARNSVVVERLRRIAGI